MTRFREDERFRAVGPENIVISAPASGAPPAAPGGTSGTDEAEIWFDWPFVDFWKSNYCPSIFILLWIGTDLLHHRCGAEGPFRRPQCDVVINKSDILLCILIPSDIPPLGQNQESAMLIASLRDVIKNQAQQIESLQAQLQQAEAAAAAKPPPPPPPAPVPAGPSEDVRRLSHLASPLY
jgi:intracellular protein transport protein USO1